MMTNISNIREVLGRSFGEDYALVYAQSSRGMDFGKLRIVWAKALMVATPIDGAKETHVFFDRNVNCLYLLMESPEWDIHRVTPPPLRKYPFTFLHLSFNKLDILRTANSRMLVSKIPCMHDDLATTVCLDEQNIAWITPKSTVTEALALALSRIGVPACEHDKAIHRLTDLMGA
jgi:hypothetical protein